MPSSFIRFEKQGFWIKDPIMEIAAAYLYVCIDTAEETEDWFIEMKDIIRMNALGFYASYMHFDFDEYLINDDRKNKFLNIIDKTIAFLQSKPPELDLQELNAFIPDEDVKDAWRGRTVTSRILNVIEYLRILITQSLEADDMMPDF